MHHAFSRVATGFLLCLILAADARGSDQPNIILILVDDLGREAVGCYGGESYPTPQIDRLASGGMRYDHFYVAPVCHPTRISIMTGRYLSNLGNPEWGSYPKGDLEKATLAWGLKEAGYATVISGKWHLAMLQNDPQHPHRLGFDQYCFFGWHEGPRFWQPRIWQNGELREDVADRFGPDVYLEFLQDFIRDNKDGPFFAYYSMTLAHAVSNDLDPHPPHGPKGRYMTFAEMLAETDLRIGQLLDFLEDEGIAENTLILFLTDNGTSAKNYIRHEGRQLIAEPPVTSTWRGQSVLGGKKHLKDWGIRVPAIAVWPGTIEPGSTNQDLIDATDILPTLFGIAGVDQLPPKQDGQSFEGTMTGEDYEERAWIISQKKDKACVRTKRWKLLDTGEIYDLKHDPLETSPILPRADSKASREARHLLQPILDPIASELIVDID